MPSVHLARQGVPVSEFLAYVLGVKEKHFRTLPSMQSWINPATDHVWQFGDVIRRLELADTMEQLALARNPVELFYHGPMADQIVEEIQRNGWENDEFILFCYFRRFTNQRGLGQLPSQNP